MLVPLVRAPLSALVDVLQRAEPEPAGSPSDASPCPPPQPARPLPAAPVSAPSAAAAHTRSAPPRSWFPRMFKHAVCESSVLAECSLIVEDALADIAREDAVLPAALTRPPVSAPQVLPYGNRGGMEVQVAVRRGVTLRRLKAAIERSLSTISRYRGVNYAMSQDASCLTYSFSAAGADGLTVHLAQPAATADGPPPPPTVRIIKDAGALHGQDFVLVANVVKAANSLLQHPSGGPGPAHPALQPAVSLQPGPEDLAAWVADGNRIQDHVFHVLFDVADLALGQAVHSLARGMQDAFEEGAEGIPREGEQQASLPPTPGVPARSLGVAAEPPTAAKGAAQKAAAALQLLESLGVQVYQPDDGAGDGDATADLDWGPLEGYQQQKQQIEDGVLLALRRPDVYDDVARGTRKTFQSNRPRAMLFTGPPGCGKTTTARVMSRQCGTPLVYVPLESIVSKWYGESEKQLAAVLQATEDLGGCIIFLDELDTLATARGGDMHEATRRTLGVLLRHMDGFEQHQRSVVVGATNRVQDLDEALISRFDSIIEFGRPDAECRQQILAAYARHLTRAALEQLTAASDGLSGRDLRDVCQDAERRWASHLVRKELVAPGETPPLPPKEQYLASVEQRQATSPQRWGGGYA